MKRILFLLFFCMGPLSVWAATTYYVTPQYTISSCASDGSSGVFLNVSTSGFGVRQGLGLPITVSGVTGCNAGINATYTSAQYTATSTQIDLPGVAYSMPLTVMGKISNGSNTAPYTTWATATPYLETILPLLANGQGDMVFVQAGTIFTRDASTHLIATKYTLPSINTYYIYGSFAGTETSIAQRPGFALNAVYPPLGIATTKFIPMGTIADTASTPSLYGWAADTNCLYETCINSTGLTGAYGPFDSGVAPTSSTWVIDGFKNLNSPASSGFLNYLTQNPDTLINGTVQNIVSVNCKALMHEQGIGVSLINALEMMHSSAPFFSIDTSSGGQTYLENIVIDDTGNSLVRTATIIQYDSNGTGNINGLTIINPRIGGAANIFSYGSTNMNTLIASNITVSGITSTKTTGTLLINGLGNAKFSKLKVNGVTMSGGLPSNLIIFTNNLTSPYSLTITDSEFLQLGFTGYNAFSVSGTGPAAINLINTIMDGTAINNSTSSTNSPIGYYRAPGSGFGGF